MRLPLMYWSIALVALAGCAHCSPRVAPPGDAFPFAMRGDDTRFHIEFDKSQTNGSPAAERALADDEMCYLIVGPATIECFTFGSMLVLAADDGESLVNDNPLDDLRPLNTDDRRTPRWRTLAAVTVIGASIERLPDALVDYLGSDGTNQDVARAVVRSLLRPGEVRLPGITRAGNLTVTVHLTEAGRRKLSDALRDRTADGTVLTSANRRRPRPMTLTRSSDHLSGGALSPRAAP